MEKGSCSCCDLMLHCLYPYQSNWVRFQSCPVNLSTLKKKTALTTHCSHNYKNYNFTITTLWDRLNGSHLWFQNMKMECAFQFYRERLVFHPPPPPPPMQSYPNCNTIITSRNPAYGANLN